jgi:mannose-6-phosphate isomerase-like protein (cupin superfamily)
MRATGGRGFIQKALLMDVLNIDRVKAFITKDGSEIRELLAHRNSAIRNQTLAEARLSLGMSTTPHRHKKTEEIYYILEGRGSMQVDKETQSVGPGDAIAIPPGSLHQIINTGTILLKFLCCCAPGYEHEDTELVE